jgi:FkbM family methyltransferase
VAGCSARCSDCNGPPYRDAELFCDPGVRWRLAGSSFIHWNSSFSVAHAVQKLDDIVGRETGVSMNPNMLISSPYGPIIVNINDMIGQQIVTSGYWASDDIALMRRIIEFAMKKHEHVRIYDAGAHIGTHTIAFAQQDTRRVTVRSFEAQRQLYYMLCGNVAINGLRNVHCHHAAVSDSTGSVLHLHLPDYDAPGNFGGLELIPALRSDNSGMRKLERETVSTLRLEEFQEEVHFIKMDVEGMEDKALRGATKIFSLYQPACFIEIHKTDYHAVIEFLRNFGYAAFLMPSGDLIGLPREHEMNMEAMQKVL